VKYLTEKKFIKPVTTRYQASRLTYYAKAFGLTREETVRLITANAVGKYGAYRINRKEEKRETTRVA